jgi:putative transposase
MANEDPLNRRVVEQMLVGGRRASMRAVSKLLSAAMVSRGVSKSAVSRRFVAKTAAQLAAWRSTALDGLDLVALLVNGVHIGEHCIIVALGLDTT